MINHDIEAKTIFLKLANEKDAEFILSLRTNKVLNRHLSEVESNLKKQKEWLVKYKERETNKKEFYFIIYRKDNENPIGTVRIYDFIYNEMSFSWGSWILNENKTRYAAIESAILVYEFAFKKLNFKRCHFSVRKENKKVIKFHGKFGVTKTSESSIDNFYHYSVESYDKFIENNKKFIK